VQGLVYRNEFNSAYDIGLRMPTQWCDSSTSHAVTQSLHKVRAQACDTKALGTGASQKEKVVQRCLCAPHIPPPWLADIMRKLIVFLLAM
jgi:hypothetical protein